MKKIWIIAGSLSLTVLIAINLNVAKSNLIPTTNIKLGSLVSLKRAFATPEDPPEKYIEETFHNDDGSCFACWSDPNGSYQVICPAEMYWTYCFPDPNGEADCQEFQDHFCDESSYSCYPDGEMCY